MIEVPLYLACRTLANLWLGPVFKAQRTLRLAHWTQPQGVCLLAAGAHPQPRTPKPLKTLTLNPYTSVQPINPRSLNPRPYPNLDTIIFIYLFTW